MLARLSTEFPALSRDGGGTRPFAGIGIGCLSVFVVGSDDTDIAAVGRVSTCCVSDLAVCA
jgi:hypothetical protein